MFRCPSLSPQVSGTLSLDLDRAEHLLVHCKWNVDLLVQRYTDDPDGLNMAAGLKFRNPQPPPSPASSCPVCLSPRSAASEPVPSLSCMHYCCRVRPSHRLGCSGWWVQGRVLMFGSVCAAVVLAGVPDGEDRAEPGDEL